MSLGLLLAACGGDRDSPAQAITDFSGDPEAVDDSFAAIHDHLRERPDELRAAALEHLGEEDPNVHYAAMYALSLTAEPGESADGLRRYLGSDDLNERFLAAGSLLARGEKEAIPVLIDLLDSEDPVAYRDPPRMAWQVARSALLTFVEQDHGLVDAEGFEDVSATKPAWERWWDEAGDAVQWIEEGTYYRSGP